ncbi:MHYT domain-containing protein [Rhodococcus sp. HNM0569]|uniref:MHYT domain-containing protein n=1 Tax=Rhodococcus sp. HNM0569 TaxID=2716340 RepID=UPI00146F1542|nr:MHYT domain-containing protein [Rhodococcus sp. HNM0569]NLU84652.1 hypothetical protein [Rhodococcus sp. HNM0569]
MSVGIEQFGMGYWVAALAAVTSFIGVFVGVASSRMASVTRAPRLRVTWMFWSALSFGLVGAWLPHFIAMAGFGVDGSRVRFDLVWVLLSLIVPVVGSGAAIVVLTPTPTRHSRSSGGVDIARAVPAILLVWLGLVGMHAALVHAARIQGSLDYTVPFTAAALVLALAISAGIVFTALLMERRIGRMAAALVLAVAITAMHYLGFAGLEATLDDTLPVPDGTEVFSVMFPAFVLAMLVSTVPITALLMAPDRVSARLDREADRLADEANDLEVLHTRG